ncbi:MAG: Mfa1 family fimbria major subunit, partial [Rikenellaceae bacterium]|nr:Mfa1 family fimbria major subunit [Rikenellaceae bacterium]
LAAACTLVLGAGGCSNDNSQGPDGGAEGKDTWMKVSFSSPTTYADNPVDGTVEESKIGTVDVFVYSSAGVLLNNRQLTDFTADASGVWTSTSTVPAKTGDVKIYVAVNMPSNVRSAMLGGSLSALDAEYDVTVADIATDNSFVMASQVIDATLEEWDGVSAMPAANQISTEVTRLAAKFTVEEAAGLVTQNIDGGEVSNLEFGVGQLNTKTLYIKNIVGGAIQGANHTKTFTSGQTADGLTGIPTNYISVNSSGETTLTLKAQYAPENTNDDNRSGNLTYYAVKAQFYPSQKASWDGSDLTVDGNSIGNVGVTFYLVKVIDNLNSGEILNLYFYDQTEAADFVTAGGYTSGSVDYTVASSSAIEYTDALCYYTVYVNFGYDYDVYRNDFYRSTITKINGLGDAAPGPIDPDVPPVDGRTDIEMSITVEPWNLVSSQDELTPQG